MLIETNALHSAAAKRAWSVPAVRRIRAGEAENGISGNTADGVFTFGS